MVEGQSVVDGSQPQTGETVIGAQLSWADSYGVEAWVTAEENVKIITSSLNRNVDWFLDWSAVAVKTV